MKLKIIVLLVLLSSLSFALDAPKSLITPGLLCTPKDKYFKELRYSEKIAYCNRSVSEKEKNKIAMSYGNITKNYWKNYEFDHLIPLCAGGSNDIRNIWLQPISEAHKKDVLENSVCFGLRKGTLTQAEAVQKIHNWFFTDIKNH